MGIFIFQEAVLTDTVERLIKNSQALHPRKVATLRRARKGKPFAQKRKEAAKFKEELFSDNRFIDRYFEMPSQEANDG